MFGDTFVNKPKSTYNTVVSPWWQGHVNSGGWEKVQYFPKVHNSQHAAEAIVKRNNSSSKYHIGVNELQDFCSKVVWNTKLHQHAGRLWLHIILSSGQQCAWEKGLTKEWVVTVKNVKPYIQNKFCTDHGNLYTLLHTLKMSNWTNLGARGLQHYKVQFHSLDSTRWSQDGKKTGQFP